MTREALLELAGAAALLTEKIRALRDAGEPKDLPNVEDKMIVDAGLVLWTVIEQAGQAIDPIKDTLRKRAVAQTGGASGRSVILEGTTPSHQCTVVIPASVVRIPAGAISDLKDTLGTNFDHLFQAVTTFRPRPDFEHNLQHLDPPVRQRLVSIVQIEDGTPRVSFRRR